MKLSNFLLNYFIIAIDDVSVAAVLSPRPKSLDNKLISNQDLQMNEFCCVLW